MIKDMIAELKEDFPPDFLFELQNIPQIITDLPVSKAVIAAYGKDREDTIIFTNQNSQAQNYLVAYGLQALLETEVDVHSWYTIIDKFKQLGYTYVSYGGFSYFIERFSVLFNVGGKLLFYKVGDKELFDIWLSTCPHNLLINKREYFMVEIAQKEEEDLMSELERELM